MLRSQTLQIEANDINTKLIGLRAKLRDGAVEMRADDGTETEAYKAWQIETSGLEGTLKTTLDRQHEAFESEDREVEERRAAGDVGGWDAEQREFIKLESRASMADYLERNLSDHGAAFAGPTAEVRPGAPGRGRGELRQRDPVGAVPGSRAAQAGPCHLDAVERAVDAGPDRPRGVRGEHGCVPRDALQLGGHRRRARSGADRGGGGHRTKG